MIKYYLLTDSEHNGMIIKKNIDTRDEWYFDRENEEWSPIAIMLRYFWPESDTFEEYDEITSKKAMEIISGH